VSRLVDTEAACLWCGRKPETLYRWAYEGRIRNHGKGQRGKAMWDLDDLPVHEPGKKLQIPPIRYLTQTPV
jgi:hypothetical protein